MNGPVETGSEALLTRHRDWIAGRRIGLVSHAAAVDRTGRSTALLLRDCTDCELTLLMAPEHGWFGTAGAGEACRDSRHPAWGVPVMSLYGDRRAPDAGMLARCDAVVLDLQDLGVRHYTYGSTLMLVLAACREAGIPLIVCDRPVPLPNTVDGPMLDPALRSFVGMLPAPMAYGMTPGETALWLRGSTMPEVELHVAAMRGYRRQPLHHLVAPPWIAPSPGIVSIQSAMSYPALVFSEAFARLDHGAGSAFSFQILTHAGWDAHALAAALQARGTPGAVWSPHWSAPPAGAPGRAPGGGVRLQVTQPDRFRPIAASVQLLVELQRLQGVRSLWHARHARPAFFDKLYGDRMVREALRAGADPETIVQAWAPGLRRFRRIRNRYLLYRP